MRPLTPFIALLALLAPAGVTAQQNRPGGDEAAIVSGGVGLAAREALAATARDHNLKLVFALVSREYLSDVEVDISGGGRRLAHRSEGPWLFAKLPPGQYTVRATFEGQTLTRTVAVGARGQKVVNFLWPATAGITGSESGRAQP